MEEIVFLSQEEAKKVDVDLVGNAYRFEMIQLIEIAGTCCAYAINDYLEKKYGDEGKKKKKILFLCGPGNNGNDAIVASRFLRNFFSFPHLSLGILRTPSTGKNAYYEALLTQATACGVEYFFIESEAEGKEREDKKERDGSTRKVEEVFGDFDVVVDGIFGFSYRANGRETESNISQCLRLMSARSRKFDVICIDVPSGWEIDRCEPQEPSPTKLSKVDANISLSCPKLCMQNFDGVHYLCDYFIPQKLMQLAHKSASPHQKIAYPKREKHQFFTILPSLSK